MQPQARRHHAGAWPRPCSRGWSGGRCPCAGGQAVAAGSASTPRMWSYMTSTRSTGVAGHGPHSPSTTATASTAPPHASMSAASALSPTPTTSEPSTPWWATHHRARVQRRRRVVGAVAWRRGVAVPRQVRCLPVRPGRGRPPAGPAVGVADVVEDDGEGHGPTSLEERAHLVHDDVGLLEVDVVAGPRDPDEVGPEPAGPLVLLLRCQVAPGVGLAAHDHQHRAPHPAHLVLEHLDVEVARHGRAEAWVRLPLEPALGRAASRGARGAATQSGLHPRVALLRAGPPSPRATPTAGGPRAGRGRPRSKSRRTTSRSAAPSAGAASAAAGGPRPSRHTSQRTRSGQAPASPVATPAPNEWATIPTVPPRRSASSARSMIMQRPGEAGVDRAAVAVTAEVDRDDVQPERGEPRRDLVEHAAVVEPAVEQEHGRRRRVAPAPQAPGAAPEVDELGPVGLRAARASRWTYRYCPVVDPLDRPAALGRRRRSHAGRSCARRRCARPSCPRSSPSRPGWSCWAGPRAPCTPGGSRRSGRRP